jgi:hypothetical protein
MQDGFKQTVKDEMNLELGFLFEIANTKPMSCFLQDREVTRTSAWGLPEDDHHLRTSSITCDYVNETSCFHY